MRVLIRGGRIVTAADDYVADLLVEDETIALIGGNLEVAADRVVDAEGRYVLPGGVDPHTHMQLPFGGTESIDTFTTGTEAAASGGTTTIIDFPCQERGQDLLAALDCWQEKLQANPPVVDVGFHMIVTDLSDGRIKGIDALVNEGVTSFKLFMAYRSALMVDDETIYRALLRARDADALVMMHAENGSVIDVLIEQALAEGRTAPKYHAATRPPLAEAEAAYRAITLAEIADAPIYLVHVSCEESLRHIEEAHLRGRPVYGETCPQYLFLDDSVYDLPGFEAAKYVFTPPARPKHHQDALWRALAFHDLASISTDHCPFCFNGQKDMFGRDDFSKIPNGGPGVENRLALVHTGGVLAGRITLNRMVDLLSTSPAKLFGLFPKKGTIAVGSDADLVIFDPARTWTIRAESQVTRADYNAYEGREVTGAVETVLSRGQVVVENGKVIGKPGHGRYLKRAGHGRPLISAPSAVGSR